MQSVLLEFDGRADRLSIQRRYADNISEGVFETVIFRNRSLFGKFMASVKYLPRCVAFEHRNFLFLLSHAGLQQENFPDKKTRTGN